MESIWFSVLVVVLLLVGLICDRGLASHASPQGFTEYCHDSTFQPRCYQPDEVVQVTHAYYGLQSRGHCRFNVDYAHTGCHDDVTDYVASVCSGLRSCDLRLPDERLSASNCPDSSSFEKYLNASYACVKVEGERSCSTCRTAGEARVSSRERGLIASVISAEAQGSTDCGSMFCPWTVEVAPGRVINITLLDYGPLPSDNAGQSSPAHGFPPYSGGSETQCTGARRYATVKERANPRDTVLCAGSGPPRRLVYTSISNKLEIHIDVDWDKRFIIQYEAAGCEDVIPPRNTWMRRNGDTVEVGCPTLREDNRWTLRCVDGQWTGEMGDHCPGVPGVSLPGDPSSEQTAAADDSDSSYLASLPINVLIAAAIAVACIIAVLSLTFCIVCTKRSQFKKRHETSRPSSIYARATSEFEFRGELRGGPPETAPMMAGSVRQRGPPTAVKPRLSTGRQYPDGFVMYDADQQAVFARPPPGMLGARPLPSLPPGGSVERRRAAAAAGGVPFQTAVQMHPAHGSMQSAACTCHTHPRPPPQLSAKTRTIGTGPAAGDDGWGPGGPMGWGTGGSAIYGNTELPYSSPDDQHTYFVLDPEVADDRPLPTPEPPPSAHSTLGGATASVATGPGLGDSDARFPTPPPPLLEATVASTPPPPPAAPVYGAMTTGRVDKGTVSGVRRQSPDGKERDEARAAGDELTGKAGAGRGCSVHEIPLRPTRDGQATAAAAAGGGLGVGPAGVACGGPGPEPGDMGTSSWP